MAITATEFDFIRELVLARSAIVLEPGKEYLIESRLTPVAREQGVETIGELVEMLRARPMGPLRERVIEAMTTNETSFFRDVRPFDALRDIVLPDLIEQHSDDRSLAIWCAASSSGQEPYTIAFVIRQHFPQLADWDIRIVATDLSNEMIERSRAGCYSQLEVNRGLPATLLVKYFSREGSGWVVNDDIRSMVEFRVLNLIEPWPVLPRCDIVFIRNVLIYFDVETKSTILDQTHKVLRPDGFLFLGGAETTLNLHDGFERVPAERAGCYRRVEETRRETLR
jgi:chemotaxis protein methyltransferase CheR